MVGKFYIINNGLKELRGHYFETAVSVAEAARELGWRPMLAAHRTCPKDLVPKWLAFHPSFATDHWMSSSLPRAKFWLKTLLPRSWHEPVQQGLQRSRQWLYRCKRRLAGLTRPQAPPHPDPLQGRLEGIGAAAEYEYLLQFQQDLSALLAATGCQAQDHIFLPTAHGRELWAILRFLAYHPQGQLPTFHLEFRHDLDVYGATYRERHRVLFTQARRFFPNDRVRLYSDTEELAERLHSYSGLPFGTLPIPFRCRLLRERTRDPKSLCIAYFGEIRDEKGFYWLPDLVDGLMDDYVRPGRVHFLIQASLDPWAACPRSRAALHRLHQYPPHQVRLVGQDRGLRAEEYFQLVSETDLLLCPYERRRYRCRSSGTFTEGVAAGIPTVVPAHTWMARQQPPLGGAAFRDRSSFIQAVKTICDQYDRYRASALAHREHWLAHHNPERLVRILLEAPQSKRQIALATEYKDCLHS